MKNIYQIKISLNGIKPQIWRRILLESNTKLYDFHKILQTTMGWTNSHLHQFIFNDKFYCDPKFDDDWNNYRQISYSNIKISDLLTKEKQSMIYEYDFGDSWEHKILLEKIMPFDKNIELPVCKAGARNCPPEDCGGVGGYEDLLEIIRDPKNNEYEETIEWLGEEFNPEIFDSEEVNELLREEDYGCTIFYD